MTVEALAAAAISGLGSEMVEVTGTEGPRVVRGFLSGSSGEHEGDRLVVGTEELMLTTSLDDGKDLELDSIVLARGFRFRVNGIYPSTISYTFALKSDDGDDT